MIALAGLGILSMPVFGADVPGPNAPANPARPGTVNYIEGAAYLNGKPLHQQSVGSLALDPGQVLTTGTGKTEVLLTPGIFLRVDSNSAVKMISPDLAQTQVQLERGRAGVEVDQIFPQNMVQVIDNGVTTQLIKPGYYEFDANQPEAMVFDGRAEVQVGDGKWETVKGHHELALVADGAREKTVGFDYHPANDELYNWSSLRSQYLAEANNQIAGEYASAPGFYPGWYWDPYMWDYTFLGWDPFFSPFGWGFYPVGRLCGLLRRRILWRTRVLRWGRGIRAGAARRSHGGGGFHGGRWIPRWRRRAAVTAPERSRRNGRIRKDPAISLLIFRFSTARINHKNHKSVYSVSDKSRIYSKAREK